MENSDFLLIRLPLPTQGRIITIVEILDVDKDGDKAKTGVNVTPKKEQRDISYIECFNYRKKDYYANRYPQK